MTALSPNATWHCQREIDLLVTSSYAEIDQDITQRNKERFVVEGGGPANGYLLRTMYRWTQIGKFYCHLFRFTTPMAYAEAMKEGTVRHCIHCGRCTARMHVGARYDQGSRQHRNRTVCLSCHADGRVLE